MAQEEEESHQDQQQREAEDQHREIEEKKPKINDFDEDHEVSEWINPRPTQYTLNKINNLKYVKLDYFTIKGCHKATADTNKSISQDTLGSPKWKAILHSAPWQQFDLPSTLGMTMT